MRYRHWLLVGAAGALFYGFVLIRMGVFLRHWAVYGDSDIHSSTAIAVVFLVMWLALEVTHYVRAGSRGVCECGYSLKGVKCPECGRDISDPPV